MLKMASSQPALAIRRTKSRAQLGHFTLAMKSLSLGYLPFGGN